MLMELGLHEKYALFKFKKNFVMFLNLICFLCCSGEIKAISLLDECQKTTIYTCVFSPHHSPESVLMSFFPRKRHIIFIEARGKIFSSWFVTIHFFKKKHPYMKNSCFTKSWCNGVSLLNDINEQVNPAIYQLLKVHMKNSDFTHVSSWSLWYY